MKSKAELRQRLAGLTTPYHHTAQILRVNHAGETGAVAIYQGQAAMISQIDDLEEVHEDILQMQAGEEKHLSFFNELLPQRNIRPSLLSPFWKIGGWVMGGVTAFISKENAMACTEAVETVIGKHYEDQLGAFEVDPIHQTLKEFKQDELDHLNHAVLDGAQTAKFYRPFNRFIQIICHASISIARKI